MTLAFKIQKAMKELHWIAPLITIVLALGISTGSQTQTVTDYDGNIYQTITIGSQVWMKENLKSLHYSNGTEIAAVWSYDDNDSYVETYGRLYSWDAAMKNSTIEGAQGVCPNGWHVPTDDEWTILGNYLGGNDMAGGKMKEQGISHWNSPNAGATNESGFTALPAGEYDDTHYQFLGEYNVIWSSTEENTTWAKYRYISYDDTGLHPYTYYKSFRYSVRCIKNEETGIKKPAFQGLIIYPNPFDHVLYFDQKKIRDKSDKSAFIYDQKGQLITAFSLESEITIKHMDNLAAGIYLVKTMVNDRVAYQKVLKR